MKLLILLKVKSVLKRPHNNKRVKSLWMNSKKLRLSKRQSGTFLQRCFTIQKAQHSITRVLKESNVAALDKAMTDLEHLTPQMSVKTLKRSTLLSCPSTGNSLSSTWKSFISWRCPEFSSPSSTYSSTIGKKSASVTPTSWTSKQWRSLSAKTSLNEWPSTTLSAKMRQNSKLIKNLALLRKTSSRSRRRKLTSTQLFLDASIDGWPRQLTWESKMYAVVEIRLPTWSMSESRLLPRTRIVLKSTKHLSRRNKL